MKVKRYQAEDMAKACELIRRELGPDAVILSSRTVRPEGMLGLLKRSMVEVTAAAGDEFEGVSTEISPLGRAALARETARKARAGKPAPKTAKHEPKTAPADSAASRAFAALLSRAAADAPQASPPPAPAARGPQDTTMLRELERSIEEMKEALDRLAARPAAPARLALPEPLISYYERLREQGLDEDLAEMLVTAVREDLPPRDFEDEEAVTECIARRLAAVLPPPRRLHLVSGRTQILFLVGPTGAGKTTTLVKLASHLTRSDLRVLLVTADTVRVGAVSQLQAYADLLGLDLRTAYTAADLRTIVQEDDGHDVLLIDTPGRNPNDAQQMEDLRSLLGAVRRKQVYLTLPANMHVREMVTLADRFEVAPLSGFIFTKLDEALTHGTVISAVHRAQRPVAFIANGQDVLGDLEPASVRRLVRLALLGQEEGEELDGPLARSA